MLSSFVMGCGSPSVTLVAMFASHSCDTSSSMDSLGLPNFEASAVAIVLNDVPRGGDRYDLESEALEGMRL